MTISVRNHRIYVDGKAVAYRQTPNGGKALPNPTGIIVHDTAGDLKGTGSISWLCDPRAKASAHVVVGYDGTITQLQALNKQTWHAGQSNYKGRPNCNSFTIGIEISNPGAMVKYGAGYSNGGAKTPEKGVKIPASMPVHHTKSPNHGLAYWLEYSPAQIEAVTELCHAIAAAYSIDFITTHWDICVPKGRKVDTNPLFPLAQLRTDVLGGKMHGFAALPAEEEFQPQVDPQDDPAGEVAAITPSADGAAVQGDPEVWHVQRRLSDMNYKTGLIDGKWGGLTGGAISGFINDRHLDIAAPTSMEMFRDVQETLKAEIAKAETQRFTRPIAVERTEASAATVAKSAPEIVPVKQNKLTAIWGAITGFCLMVFNAVSEYLRDAVAWLANIKDFFTDVPGEIWFALGIGIAIFLWWQARRGEEGITNAVKNGERL